MLRRDLLKGLAALLGVAAGMPPAPAPTTIVFGYTSFPDTLQRAARIARAEVAAAHAVNTPRHPNCRCVWVTHQFEDGSSVGHWASKE